MLQFEKSSRGDAFICDCCRMQYYTCNCLGYWVGRDFRYEVKKIFCNGCYQSYRDGPCQYCEENFSPDDPNYENYLMVRY